MTIKLEKAIQAPSVQYKGQGSYVLPAGTRVQFRMKEPHSSIEEFFDETVPEGKQWNFVLTIVSHESDEVS